MDEDDTQHLDGPMAALLTAAVVLMAAGLLTAVVALTGCAAHIHVEAGPEPVKRAATVARPAGFITQDGGSKDA